MRLSLPAQRIRTPSFYLLQLMHCCYLAKTIEERPAETHTETEAGDAGFFLGYLAYTVKKRLPIFRSSAEMSLTKLLLGGNNLIIPGQREFMVSDIPAGDGKIGNLFFTV